jgi:hypothetical protein
VPDASASSELVIEEGVAHRLPRAMEAAASAMCHPDATADLTRLDWRLGI